MNQEIQNNFIVEPFKANLIMTDYSIISENDKQFADEFSRFVNGKMSSAKKTGIELANDHRFLVQEKFKVAMYFIEQLAANYQKGYYDPRDEWACKLADETIKHLSEEELYYPTI